MILITETAWQKIEEKLSGSGYSNLRVSLNNKGCGGSSYVFEPTSDEKSKTDYHIDNGNYTVLISREVHRLIDSSVLDWVIKDQFNQGFDIVNNSQELSRCGCGESVILASESYGVIPAKRLDNLAELAAKTTKSRKRKPLPPRPGQIPVPSSVPESEILNKKP